MEEFLGELQQSGAVLELLHHLETSAPKFHPSSTSLCLALSRAWSSLPPSRQSISSDVGSETPQETDRYPQACKMDQFAKPEPWKCDTEFWAQAALDYSWEQLHSGHWQDVQLFWRQAYSLASLLKAFYSISQRKDREALVDIDKGILLGAPILNHSLHGIATLISKRLMQEEKTGSSTDMKGGNDRMTRRTGKIKFRNYTLQSPSLLSTNKKIKLLDSKEISAEEMECVLGGGTKDIPLIDMERRLPILYCPSLDDFHKHYMTCSVPMVISGAMDHWPAYAEKKWK